VNIELGVNTSGTAHCGARLVAVRAGADTYIHHQFVRGSNPSNWRFSCTLPGNWAWHSLCPMTLFLSAQKERLVKNMYSWQNGLDWKTMK